MSPGHAKACPDLRQRGIATAVIITTLVYMVLGSGLAEATHIGSVFGETFDSDPFAAPARWARSDTVCVLYRSTPRDVQLGDWGQLCPGPELLSHPATTTYSASEATAFSMDFSATFTENPGSSGGPAWHFFGFRENNGGFTSGTTDHIALWARQYFTPECVTITASFRFSDNTDTFPGTESACSLAFNTQYTGQIRYSGSTGVLRVSLGPLSETIIRAAAKTLTIQRTSIQAEGGIADKTFVDDISYNVGHEESSGEDDGGSGGVPGENPWILPPVALSLARLICHPGIVSIDCRVELTANVTGVVIGQSRWFIDGSYAGIGSALDPRIHVIRLSIFAFPIRDVNVTVQLLLTNSQTLVLWGTTEIDNAWILIVISLVIIAALIAYIRRYSKARRSGSGKEVSP